MSTLYLLVPGLFDSPYPDVSGDHPNLDMLLSRSHHVVENEDNFESLLCSFFDVHALQGEDLPSAALMLSGEGGEPHSDYWAAVAPVHLHADRDRLLLSPLPCSAIEQADIDRLREAFNRHFGDDGLELFTDYPQRWYLRLRQQRKLTTASLTQVAGRSLDPFLPQGADAPWLRGLMNESQMLLHSLDIPSLNGLWMWGFGRLPQLLQSPFGELSGTHPLLRGLQLHSATACRGDDRLLVADACQQALESGSRRLWIEAVESLDALLAGELKALSTGGLGQITLLDGAGLRFEFRPWMRFRWWRKPYPGNP
ncbi:MAG: hypothetical protein ABFR19_02380 [Pseudomonadota bacterium]